MNNTTNQNGTTTTTSTTTSKDEQLDPQPTTDSIAQALVALYSPTSTEQIRDFAQNWLMKVQKLPNAWEFCPTLILETSIVELQYFGANTLEYKLKNEWHNLPKDMKEKVLKVVIDVTRRVTNKLPSIVVTRMCVVVSYTVMYTYTTLWENPIENIMQLACPDLDRPLFNIQHELLRFVLEFLSVLPFELQKESLACQYRVINKAVSSCIDRIFKFLLAMLSSMVTSDACQQYSAETQQIFKSLGGWLRYKLPSPTILGCVFDTCLQIVAREPTYLELLVNMINNSLRHLHSINMSSEYPQEFAKIADRTCKVLPEFYGMAIRSNNVTASRAIFHSFVQIMYYNLDKVLPADLIARYFELILQCIQIGDRDICSTLFPLLEDFKTHSEYMSLDEKLLSAFFLRILDRVRELASHPLDHSLDGDELQEFINFRMAAREALSPIQMYVLTYRRLLIDHLIERLQNDIKNQAPSWQTYESTLYFISSLSEGFQGNDLSFVPTLLQLIPSIHCKSLELVRTSIKLFGKYASFLRENKEYLEKVVFDLIPAFASPELLSVAANSFLNIATNHSCSQKLTLHINRIIDLCSPHLVTNQSHPAITIVYHALLYIIHVIPTEKLMPPFQKLLSPIIQNINNIIQQKPKTTGFLKIQLQIYQHTTKIIEIEDQEDKHKHPLFPFLQVIVPQLKTLLNDYTQDCEIVELVSMIYRWTLLFCRNIVTDFTPEILGQATMAYQRYPLPFLLQVLQATTSFVKIPADVEISLRESVSLVSTTTLNLLRTETANMNLPQEYPIDPQYHLNFSVRTDLTKDYLSLIQSCFTSSPQCLDPNIVSALIIYIIHNVLDIKNLLTSRFSFSFLSTVLTSIKSNDQKHQHFVQPIHDAMSIHGKVLIRNLLTGIVSVFPSSLIHNVSEVFHSYASAYPTPFRREAAKILVQSPFLDDSISLCDRQIFLSQLQRTSENKNDYRFAIQTFSILCKGK